MNASDFHWPSIFIVESGKPSKAAAVQFSKWVKQDGSIQICGDYKQTVNQAYLVDPYPLSRIDDLFTSLFGGKKFSKLDLSKAYQQLVLAELSRELMTINTHKGLYRYTRLPLGISPAPATFSKNYQYP